MNHVRLLLVEITQQKSSYSTGNSKILFANRIMKVSVSGPWNVNFTVTKNKEAF